MFSTTLSPTSTCMRWTCTSESKPESNATLYAPIVQSLHSLADDERKRLRAKFDTAYFVATEQLVYRKYPRISELEAWHRVNLSSSYLHENNTGKEIALSNQNGTICFPPSVMRSFSLCWWMDGKSNTNNELLLVLCCDPNGVNEKIHTTMNFLSIYKPEYVTAEGLLQSLQHGLQCHGIQSVDKESGSRCHRWSWIGREGTRMGLLLGSQAWASSQRCTSRYYLWMKCSFVSTTSTRNLPRNAENWKPSSLTWNEHCTSMTRD